MEQVTFSRGGGGGKVDGEGDSDWIIAGGGDTPIDGVDEDAEIRPGCDCVECCDYHCQTTLGSITHAWEFLLQTIPFFHPSGGASQQVSGVNAYTFATWESLNYNAANLGLGQYTSGRKAVSTNGGEECLHTSWAIFGPVNTNYGPISVQNFLGGDPTDLSNYASGTVSGKVGLFDAFFTELQGGEVTHSITGGRWTVNDCLTYSYENDFGCFDGYEILDKSDGEGSSDYRGPLPYDFYEKDELPVNYDSVQFALGYGVTHFCFPTRIFGKEDRPELLHSILL